METDVGNEPEVHERLVGGREDDGLRFSSREDLLYRLDLLLVYDYLLEDLLPQLV